MKSLKPILMIFVLEVFLFKKVSADFDAGKLNYNFIFKKVVPDTQKNEKKDNNNLIAV